MGRSVLGEGRLELGKRLVRRSGPDAVVLVDDDELALLALGVDPLSLRTGGTAEGRDQ